MWCSPISVFGVGRDQCRSHRLPLKPESSGRLHVSQRIASYGGEQEGNCDCNIYFSFLKSGGDLLNPENPEKFQGCKRILMKHEPYKKGLA